MTTTPDHDRARRRWLAGASTLAGALGAGVPLVTRAQSAHSPRLVVVLLRGAVDGLSVVVPHADDAYYRDRPTIALPRPGQDDGLVALDPTFGLHPALAPLAPWWNAGRLAFVHAAGSPDPTRSHFDAQDYLESGTPGRKRTPDGWMNRLLGVLIEREGESHARALNLGPVMPRIYAGTAPVSAVPAGARATRASALDNPVVAERFGALYRNDAALAPAWQSLGEARRAVGEAMAGDMAGADAVGGDPRADQGARGAAALSADAVRLGTLMRRDPAMRLAFVAVGGWDTHANQGAARGPLANRLQALGAGIDAFVRALGPALEDTVVMVVSEFGRTVRQNGNGGTDHGHGNAIWLLGGPVAGGRVHGRWPGLHESERYEGRDLAVTTDFRQVIAPLLQRHLRLDDAALARVLPEMPREAPLDGLLRA